MMTITLPNTGGRQTYQTVGAGTFSLAAGSTHTVRVEFVNGPLNLNYWTNRPRRSPWPGVVPSRPAAAGPYVRRSTPR